VGVQLIVEDQMIDSFYSLTVPTQAVIGIAIAGLLILLITAQLVDFEGSNLKPMITYLRIFSIPLLALFIFVMILRIFVAIRS
jgi:hypothetical protein